MDHNFSIFMFIFAGLILLYAALLAITKDYNLLPYRSRISVEPKDPKKYMVQLAKVVALVAGAVAVGAAISLWNMAVGGIAMVVCVIGALWIGTKIVKNE